MDLSQLILGHHLNLGPELELNMYVSRLAYVCSTMTWEISYF
jgi:hypothetical protein